MAENELIQLFWEQKVRTKWDDENQKWYFSIVDVCGVLTDQPDEKHARNYWKVLKHRLKKEGNETVTNCNQLKLRATDGKMRLTDVAEASTTEISKAQNPKGFKRPRRTWNHRCGDRRGDRNHRFPGCKITHINSDWPSIYTYKTLLKDFSYIWLRLGNKKKN